MIFEVWFRIKKDYIWRKFINLILTQLLDFMEGKMKNVGNFPKAMHLYDYYLY